MSTSLLKLKLLSLRHKLSRYFLMNKKIWILSRTACLFNDTLVVMGLTMIPRYNIQKGRIDLWLDFFKGKRVKPKFEMIKFIERFDIKGLFLQQYHFLLFRQKQPYMFVLDSYSELVDRKFFFKAQENKYFFSYADDIIPGSDAVLDNDGLLQVDAMYDLYENFFEKFREFYPFCPIVFILVPNKLETREFFIMRSKVINDSIQRISKKFDDFHVIEIPESVIFNHPSDNHPYHYSEDVYLYLAKELKGKQLFKKLQYYYINSVKNISKIK